MKDELDRKTMKGLPTLRYKMYRYLTDDECVDKKTKCRKNYVSKREIKFVDYKKCLENNEALWNSRASGVKHTVYS